MFPPLDGYWLSVQQDPESLQRRISGHVCERGGMQTRLTGKERSTVNVVDTMPWAEEVKQSTGMVPPDLPS